MTYSYIEYRWSVRSVVLSPKKKSGNLRKKTISISSVAPTMLAPDSHSWVRCCFTTQIDVWMPWCFPMIRSRCEMWNKNSYERSNLKIGLDIFAGLAVKKNITLSLSNNFHQHWKGKSSSKLCYITWLGAYLFIALSKSEFALRNSR